MAEFKLGRIKFVWKGNWGTGTAYFVDDVVRFGGKTYICRTNHQASPNFYTDLGFTPTRWNQMTDGQSWKDEWVSSSSYVVGDVVKYGGNLYIATTPHTSAATTALGLEEDLSKWDLYAEGTSWSGEWAISTRYKKSDLIRYSGYTYICNEGHTSADNIEDGLEYDQSKWDIFNPGIEYKGTWVDDVKYIINDVVKYGANLWVCVTNHTSASTFTIDEENWETFVEGFEFEGDWSNLIEYQPGDVVRYGGNQYVALLNHTNQNPATNVENWRLFSEGLRFVNEWDDETEYLIGNVVRLNGYTYLATADNTNSEPPSADWSRLNSGLDWKGAWSDEVDYKLGDVVRQNTNAYYCIEAHTSEDGVNDPATDSAGEYWSLFSIGTETAVLTTQGDMVYYNGSGPTRLPIGREGQLLRSSGTVPEWVTLGEIEQVYYVAPHGVDSPSPVHGKTWDKPFKTIRYACEQVEKGPRNANAQYLLELNRVFIQREVTEWIQTQIDTDTGIWENFTYDSAKCERDVGFIVDRLIWDIGHGGNLKTRAAAQTLLGVLSDGPFSNEDDENGTGEYAGLVDEADQGVAAYNYMLSLVEKVLNNQEPVVNYQEANEVEDKAEQYINVNLPAESTAFAEVQSLVNIVITALATQDADNIPDRYVPNTLIQIATGRYRETLPIIVPAYTCIQGDELRSTNAGAAGSLIDISDSYYTIDTFGHIANVVSNIVTGTTVTPSTGNTVDQYDAWPVATASEATVVNSLVNVMKLQSDYRLGTMHSAYLTDPTSYDSGLANARKLIKENKQFLQEEVIAFMIETYPSLRYGKTKTRRDVGYIVDALIYDLTYGGNALSVQAGLAYWDGDDDSQPQLPASIKAATLAAIEFLKTRMQAVATGGTITPLQTTVARYTDTVGSAGASTVIGNNIDVIIEIIDEGPEDAVYTLTDPTPADGVNSTTALIADYTTISASGFDAIQDAVEAYLAANYSDVDYSAEKARRDAAIVTKAVAFDFMFNSNYQTIKAAHAYLRLTASELFDRDDRIKEATRNSLIVARDTALGLMSNATAETRLTEGFKIVDDVIFGGSTEGDVCSTEVQNRDYAILQLERNREFILAETSAYIASTFNDVVTDTVDTTNIITISDTTWLRRGVAIKFTGSVFGGIVADTTYYVLTINSTTTFTVSATRNGPSIVLTTDSGSMDVELVYNESLCLRDVETYIDALKWDLKYTSNYKSYYVARYYANAVLGSQEEDMYYLRDGTGIRNQSLDGLNGDLTPPNEYNTSRVTAGAYASLDPGWGPADFRTWINSRSPYVQGVTTFGNGAIGQKIDGSLHNGGNDSIVSNDFTQVISDGIGAWVANNGRAELVSVFSYYAHVGYLSTEGGRIRGTNGNNSYGEFGAVAEGVDNTETPNTAVVDNKFQFKATVGSLFTGLGSILNFEFENAGTDYTEVAYTVTGGNGNAVVVGDEFRNDGVFEVRLLDNAPVGSNGMAGGFGYVTNSNTAQGGSSSTIILAQTDPESDTAYIGMKVIITGGTGVGQYGIISAYNSGTKVAEVDTESTGAAGWDHLVPGTTIVSPDGSSTYTVEPALSFTAPTYNSAEPSGTKPANSTYADIKFVKSEVSYLEVTGTSSNLGAGAKFNIIKTGTKYRVYISREVDGATFIRGTGYNRLETITISGTSLGGISPTNDLVITVTSINETTGAILAFDFTGVGDGGNFVAVANTSTAARWNGVSENWATSTLPASASWKSVANGRVTIEISAADMVAGQSYIVSELNDSLFTQAGAETNTVGTYFIATKDLPSEDPGTVKQVKNVSVAIASGTDETAYSTDGGLTWTAGGNLPASTDWTSIAYGGGVWVAIATDSNETAYSTDGGLTWTAGGNLPASTDWTSIAYGAGKFVAVASDGTQAASSINGSTTWVSRTLPSSSAWNSVTYGNNRFVAVSSTSGAIAAYSLDGASWTASTLPSTAVWTSVTYGQGVFVAVSTSTAAATSEDGIVWTARTISTSNSVAVGFGDASQTGKFVTISNTGTSNTSTVLTGATAKARVLVADSRIFGIRITEPGSNYAVAPTMTVTDPNAVFALPFQVRSGKGVLATPTFISRGTGYNTANASVDDRFSDGYADFFQKGIFVAVRRITQRPVPGSNVVFSHLPNRVFKLVQVITFRGDNDGSYSAFYQVSPPIETVDSPTSGVTVTTRIRYSQVRLTGHDFLDVGTGGFTTTNYPNDPLENFSPAPENETVENGGGRVFYTSTDQDGNFRVGGLFAIEQSTGVATLNADAFNISGLQELNLGNVTLGGGSATITEFSTDPFFTADSDNIVPTQRAIRAYISSQIGGGGATLNVNKIIAGNIEISTNQITNVTGESIKMGATFEFRGGVTGYPIAWNYFLN